MDVVPGDVVLCAFYFSDLKTHKRRPVIVFKDNLPFDDFVGIPVSSQTAQLHDDESILEPFDLSIGTLPKRSKIMVRKTFVIAKPVIVKRYGRLSKTRFQQLHRHFCHFFGCCPNMTDGPRQAQSQCMP
ncbi:type II toxin-antitoxin system PemK/MazF family toxin [Ectothiorhodospira mobilis]|uniref:mRNA interferase MazF n=1 Tax=Ectothiorhodospira mobilis TaxID=195064 RepID=A0A1I4RJH6_ECTMO|nr:type II toxin-antitoxin system PemK/MazF family toxin [Ectothiorhodospira mobilis]MCG5536027.1 type II toxin-antitoxin system PemK/MazF family toxin [Ectothiorhodospira mobilis]SFM52378.1 mRNA interferase MazF [Ectothiorhodospira mobilis]